MVRSSSSAVGVGVGVSTGGGLSSGGGSVGTGGLSGSGVGSWGSTFGAPGVGTDSEVIMRRSYPFRRGSTPRRRVGDAIPSLG